MDDKDEKTDPTPAAPAEPEVEEVQGCIMGHLEDFPGGPEAYARFVKMEHDAIVAARVKRGGRLH
jgi:hypothetical protein